MPLLKLQSAAKPYIGLVETQDIALLKIQDIALVETQDIPLVEPQDIPLVETQDIALPETKDIAPIGSESGLGEAQDFFILTRQKIIG